MKRSMNRRTIYLAVIALILVLGLAVGQAMAYFTAYATASGGAQISLGATHTELLEKVENQSKLIQVQNTGDYECYVRVKIFAGDQYPLNISDADGAWAEMDGYWYYNEILPAGASTGTLKAAISFPEDAESGESFQVIVVQESTAVLYLEDGTAYADWDAVYETEEGAE